MKIHQVQVLSRLSPLKDARDGQDKVGVTGTRPDRLFSQPARFPLCGQYTERAFRCNLSINQLLKMLTINQVGIPGRQLAGGCPSPHTLQRLTGQPPRAPLNQLLLKPQRCQPRPPPQEWSCARAILLRKARRLDRGQSGTWFAP